MSLALLRKAIVKDYINRLWQSAMHSGAQGRPCPVCNKFMTEVLASPDRNAPRLDLCKACYFVWFDPKEYEELPPAPPPEECPNPKLPQEAREFLAIHQMEFIKASRQDTFDTDAAPPEEWWKKVLGVVGMPVEFDAPALRDVPWLTWGLAAAITLVSVLAFSDFNRAIQDFSLIPAEAWRNSGLTFLTAFFLHGGVLHLVGNMYFLVIFGAHVEDYFGKWRYLLLILLATFAGDILHIALDPRTQIPIIGASGGISGVIVLYALQFPHARLGWFVWGSLAHRKTVGDWIRMPASLAIIFWILLQLLGTWKQAYGITNVSSLVHLGGAAVGFCCWLMWRKG